MADRSTAREFEPLVVSTIGKALLRQKLLMVTPANRLRTRYSSAVVAYLVSSDRDQPASKTAEPAIMTKTRQHLDQRSKDVLDKVFAIGTPVLAVLLTIIAGFSQNFQWGAAWQNMVLSAQRLEKERDRFVVTTVDERDYAKELDLLNDLVLDESEGFFDRMLGGGKPPTR